MVLISHVVIVIFCFVYLGFYLKEIVSPPKLAINSPTENFTTDKHSIMVIGTTEPETQIVINGGPVLSNPEGEFTREINLKNGINIVTISAKKKYCRENTITRQILVKND